MHKLYYHLDTLITSAKKMIKHHVTVLSLNLAIRMVHRNKQFVCNDLSNSVI